MAEKKRTGGPTAHLGTVKQQRAKVIKGDKRKTSQASTTKTRKETGRY